jgi:hypothetical protein
MRKHCSVIVALGLSILPLAARAAAPPVAQEKAQVIAQSNGFVSGQIKQVSGGTLNLTPYNGSTTLTQLYLPANTPVYQGNGKITAAGLVPGVDARVHYKDGSSGQPPQVVAVEVLNKQDAQAARQQAVSAPPQMVAQAPQPTAVSPQGAAQSMTPQQVTPPPTGQLAPGQLAPQPTAQATPQTQQQKTDLLARASGSQPGKLDKVSANYIMLKPYQHAAGEATIRFDPSVPVYEGQGQVSWQALHPGTDIRVYYQAQGTHEQPKALAVEILNSTDAQQLQKSERDIPRGK